MIFTGLARLVTRHYRFVIILWLVLLGVSYPLFSRYQSVLSSQQGSVLSSNRESDLAQKIIDSNFSSSSEPTLVVVINTQNVTTGAVHRFVDDLGNLSSSVSGLSNLTSVSTTYKAVSSVVRGATTLTRSVENATLLSTELIFGVPAGFVQVWTQAFQRNPQMIPQAKQLTQQIVSNQVQNKTLALLASQYLDTFTVALASNLQGAGGATTNETIQSSIVESATSLISTYFPPQQRAFATQVLHSFTVSNYSDNSAIENFVTRQVTSYALYTPTFVSAVYPIATASVPSQAASDQLLESIVANPTRLGVPAIYRSAVTGFVSPDHTVMLVVLSFRGVTDDTILQVRKTVGQLALPYGLASSVQVTGPAALSYDFKASTVNDNTVILPITLSILIIATALFFRSALTPFASLGTIGVAIGLAEAAVFLLGTYVTQIDTTTPTVLLAVMLGVGTDYTIFLLARYREERTKGFDTPTSVTNAVAWAGESIATSGATVVISFFMLTLQPVTLLRGFGLVVGSGVLIALVASLTLVPSILMLIPNYVFWPNMGKRFENYAAGVRSALEKGSGYFSRSGQFAIKHAKLIVVLSIFATAPAVYVWSQLAVSYDFTSAAPQNLESVSAFNTMTKEFGAGSLFPTYAVIHLSNPVWNGSAYSIKELDVVDQISSRTLLLDGVLSVTGPTRPGGEHADYALLGNDSRSRLLIANMNQMISKDGHYVLLTIVLARSPFSSESIATTSEMRQTYASIVSANGGTLVGVYVGGQSGATLDTKGTVNDQFLRVITYVMLAVGVVLLLVLGSLFLPLFAIVTIVMSIAWTLAATSIVFQQFYNSQILYITPLALFVLLLGLGMDYNIFILTRIREEASNGKPLNEAITTSIQRTGGIITAAAVILAASLGALMLSGNLLLKEFGFAFAYSILIDALLMRTYIVPAVMSLMGKWNWYAPGRLQRVRVKNEAKQSR